MSGQNYAELFRGCHPGETLRVYSDRGNGEINGTNFFYGINPFDGAPLLINVENLGRKPVVFFDVANPLLEIEITKIEKILSLL